MRGLENLRRTAWALLTVVLLCTPSLTCAHISPAAVGRFLSPDPSRFADSRNLYAYCGNDPVNGYDPDGMLEKQLQNTESQSAWSVGQAQMQQFNSDYQRMSDALKAGDTYTYDQLNTQLSGQLSDSINSALTPLATIATAFSPVHGLANGITDFIEGSQSGNLGTMGLGLLGMVSVLPGGSELRALGAETRIVAGEASAVTRAAEATAARTASGDFYSVAFQTTLDPASYPGLSRAAHFQEANEALLTAMESDPQFAQTMQQAGVNLDRTATGLAPRTPPEGWTWHHAEDPGVMQLVPRVQHTPGSIFWDTLHPGGQGGYAIWGKQ